MSNEIQKISRLKRVKKPKIIAVVPNLYLKITKKGKKRWMLSTYHKKENCGELGCELKKWERG